MPCHAMQLILFERLTDDVLLARKQVVEVAEQRIDDMHLS